MARFHNVDPESIRRRLAEIAAVEASRRSIALRSVCAMVASVAVSIVIMGWGFSMDNVDLGPAIFFCGALLGNLGIVITLLWTYRASEG